MKWVNRFLNASEVAVIVPNREVPLEKLGMRAGLDDEEAESKDAAVDHPAHYNSHPAGVECIDIVEDFNFNVGNAIKYLWRAGLKETTTYQEDLKKALWYINRELDRAKRM